ncbi:hypothetical protein MUP01_11100 [Candidatus Bathyarchaeota archaeon]|nr:hypothetical protein [Candidatus Bathyarchaeota archaeon]
MGKKVKHMGMNLTEEEHEKWRREQHQITPKQHEALMKRMNIGKEEDERGHKDNEVVQKESIRQERKPVNPFNFLYLGFLHESKIQSSSCLLHPFHDELNQTNLPER